MGSSQTRGQTCVSCIGKWILYYWATREALSSIFLKHILEKYSWANTWYMNESNTWYMNEPGTGMINPITLYMNEFKPWNWSCQDCTTTSELKKEDVSYWRFLPFWSSLNEFEILSHTADCLFSELSDHFVSITRKQQSMIEWASPPVLWTVIFDTAKDRILSTEATNSNSCVKIITITLINHHWPMINHHHHHSHWLTAYEAKCKHYAKCLGIYTTVCLQRRLQLFRDPWAGTFAVWPCHIPH